jgi:hypothetical protein
LEKPGALPTMRMSVRPEIEEVTCPARERARGGVDDGSEGARG